MLTPSILIALASTSLIEARSVHDVTHMHNHVYKRQADSVNLADNALQRGSFLDGSTSPTANAAQAKSLTSKNNFINHCSGKKLTNGFQILEGSCNGIPMGDIPSKSNMISSMITFPENGSRDIQSETTFNITVQVSNLIAGTFTNPVSTYYAAPQTLKGGKIVGHTHVTVQDTGRNLNPTIPLDPTIFAFFKGINDQGNGRGLLQATVTGGLPAGNYRVCTMVASTNHQPALMPVAQRGAQDDCTKFTVVGNGKKINDAANNGIKGIAAAAKAQSAVDAGVGLQPGKGSAATSSIETTRESVVTATPLPPFSNSTKTAKGNGGKGKPTKIRNGGGNGGKGGTKPTSIAPESTSIVAVKTNNAGGNGGNGGKGATKVQSGRPSKPTGKRIITVIETFFVFKKSHGGTCPSVRKGGQNGNQFKVLGELFDSLASAAQAACGHQFTTCISFTGPGFSIEECTTQKKDCAAVASTQRATASAPSTMTASIIIPIDATVTKVPGSVIATETIAASTTAAVVPGKEAAITQVPSAEQTSACAAVVTVTVDAPVKVASALPTIISSKIPPFSNSTATAKAFPLAASSVSTSTSGAVGGIAAPSITNSGDSTRPFSVNGNTFVNKVAAVQRSCDVQFNACANAVNGGKLSGVVFADCTTQQTACRKQ